MSIALTIPSSTEEDKSNLSLDSICRCCLNKQAKLKPIFNSIGSIPEAIFLFTSVKFTEHDGLPGNICINCLQHLDKCIDFKQKVETNDLFLRQYMTDLRPKTTVGTSLFRVVPEDQRCNQLEQIEVDWNPSTNKTSGEGCGENTPSKIYSCTVCRRSYASKCAYNRHIKAHSHEDNIFRCNDCGKRFRDKNIFECHQICHTQKKTDPSGQMYSCPDCKDNFTVQRDLFVHSALHGNASKLECKACGKYFENLAKLKRHIPRHFMDKPFKCNKCDMAFAEMASLTRHFQKHIGNKRKSMHICSVCKKCYPNQYTLKVHTRNHTGERPWECTKCDKRFTDFRLLNSHKKLHEDGKPYACEQCKNRFRHHSTLITHMRTHTGDRPYRCDKCKKSYKQSWRLLIHKQIHAARKRFLCDQCSQVFTTTASLADHQRWHSNETESDRKKTPLEFFQCNQCSEQFPSRLDLITHEKLTHALSHECDTCLGKWKTLEELVQHKCDEALEVSSEPSPDEMILLPNGEIQDCNTIVNALLASISPPSDGKETTNK